MSTVLNEVLAANEEYAASFGSKSELALPPARGFAILTCMDTRLDPAKYAGLAEGDAHVIRNAGGRASDDAIRSLVICYKLLGHQGVVRHPPHRLRHGVLYRRPRSAACWRTASRPPREQAVAEDVRRIRNHPLVPGRFPVYGYVYDVGSGRLIEVPDATREGAAR